MLFTEIINESKAIKAKQVWTLANGKDVIVVGADYQPGYWNVVVVDDGSPYRLHKSEFENARIKMPGPLVNSPRFKKYFK